MKAGNKMTIKGSGIAYSIVGRSIKTEYPLFPKIKPRYRDKMTIEEIMSADWEVFDEDEK